MSSQLENIKGIGSKLAEELNEKGIKTKKDLYKKEVFKTLPKATQYHLKYKPKLIPIEEGREIIKELRKTFPDLTYAGSLRREKDISGDLDIILLLSKSEFLKKIESSSNQFKIYAIGDSKCSLIYTGYYFNVKIDFFFSNKKELPAMLLYLTGNRIFNIRIRKEAKNKGYLLNQYGLFKNGERVKVKDEKDIFTKLGIKYKIPKERTH